MMRGHRPPSGYMGVPSQACPGGLLPVRRARGSAQAGRRAVAGMTGPQADEDAEALLRIAVAAAGEAGLLASWRGDERPEVVETKSSPTDVVTEMDRRSEALITSRIRAHRPGDAVLGEEGGQTAGGPAGGESDGGRPGRVRWVVDPLDGTVNYLYGLFDWAVSIAAEVDGTVVAGVVEVPRHGETFTAVAGQGAWLHRGEARVALHCTSGVPLGQALVGTGFGYDSGRRRVQGEVIAALLPYVRDITAWRLRRRGPVLGGRRAPRRVLRARPELLGLRGGRPDRPRGGRGGRRAGRQDGEHLHGGGRGSGPLPAARYVS